MLIIYHDVGGAHSTQVAAWVHLGRLAPDRVPAKEELMAIPLYDKAEKKDMGRLKLAGVDEFGNRVFTLGRQYTDKILVSALEDLHQAMGGDPEDLMLVNMKPTINLLMKIGGGSSRRFHWVSFGRPIVIRGTQKAYPNIVSLVSTVKREEERRAKKVNQNAVPYEKVIPRTPTSPPL